MRFDKAMKVKQFQALAKKLLPHLPGYALERKLLYATPVGHVLRGFCLEASGFDATGFYVWVFFQPLYVPAEHLHLTLGERLRYMGSEGWNITDANVEDRLLESIRTQGLPFLTGVEEPLGVADVSRKRWGELRNPHIWEAIAYSLIMGNDYSAARAALQRLLASLDGGVEWQEQIKLRAEKVKSKLDANPEEAKRQLEEWELSTKTNLRLEIAK